MRIGQRHDPGREIAHEVFDAATRSGRRAQHGLHIGKRVLDSVVQFTDQQPLTVRHLLLLIDIRLDLELARSSAQRRTHRIGEAGREERSFEYDQIPIQ